jgi:putative hydrolase
MKVIGISDHGPSDSETIVSEIYFKTLNRLPKKINGIRVFNGIEANIINTKGELDISDNVIEKLDYVMANFHKETVYKNRGSKKNTEAIINAIRSGKIDIITHPFAIGSFPLDIKKACEEACKNNVLMEINLAYLVGSKFKPFTIPNLKIMINTLKKYKKKTIIGSDAHNIWELADDTPLNKIKKEIGLTDDMIINNYPKELFRLLKINE